MSTQVKSMFTRILSVCPPSSVTSRLDRAASTSSISGSLEWSRGSLDMVSLQMWYYGDIHSKQCCGLSPLPWPKCEVSKAKESFWSSATWLKRLCKTEEAWVRGRSERCRARLHQCVGEREAEVNHCPDSCKITSERITRRAEISDTRAQTMSHLQWLIIRPFQ